MNAKSVTAHLIGPSLHRAALTHLIALVILINVVSDALAAGYIFSPIVFPGTTLTVAFGINNVGEVIVGEYGCCVLPLANSAFLLSAGTFTTLPNVPGADATNATAINDTGDIVGTYLSGGVQHGFLLSGSVFTTIDFPAASLTQVFGINNAGHIVGETAGSSFLLSGGAFTTINVPGASDTAARAINNLGDSVGFYSSGGNVHGFLLSAGTFSTINFPGAAETYVLGTNDLGDIVGRYQILAGGSGHGFLLSAGSFTTLDAPGFADTVLYGINNAGDIVGQAYNSNQLVSEGVLFSRIPDRTLTVSLSGSGSGTVESTPAGLTCPSDCSGTYDDGTSVTLVATPAPDSLFAGWTGDAGCSTGVVDLVADKHCTATFNLAFRDVRRPGDINPGADPGGTEHPVINFTGSTGSAGDTWLTVYDETPDSPGQTIFTGSVHLSADVLTRKYNNKKGAGLVALYNEGVGKKGLALIVYNAGNTDTLVLATVDQAGKLTTLKSVPLGAGILENAWYRLSMDVVIGTLAQLSVTGKVFNHATPRDPDGGVGAQVGGTLSFSGPRPTGVDASGEAGIIASAISATVDSSVANFSVAQ